MCRASGKKMNFFPKKILTIARGFVILSFSAQLLYAMDLIKPIPHNLTVNPSKAKLGKKLFFDPILSKDDTISCASCHDLENAGVDNTMFSIGIEGQMGSINAPTVYNAVFNFRQFWDGRAIDLKEQAKGPIENPIEMGHSLMGAADAIKSNEYYRDIFKEIYSDGVTIENIADAIAEFEKLLITPDAPFDKYLRGENDAISQSAKRGYKLFLSKGCIICHHGVNIGGNMYNKFGIFRDANSTNLGRYNITKNDEDKYLFKVPSLRNIAKTAPYMHDGRIDTLKDAVLFMSQYQLGREMAAKEIDDIVSFLESLTGVIPEIAK